LLVIGGNQTFSLPNTLPITVSYTIPDVTHQQVPVTFICDAEYVTDPVTNCHRGPFNGWPAPGTPMVDPDNDKLWR